MTPFESVNLLLSVAALCGVGLLRYYLPSYLQEKGKNLASREDVEEITRKVESVRAEFAGGHERLRSELQRSQEVLRALFDLELESYREVWAVVDEVRDATLGLRPVFDMAPRDEQERRQRTATRWERANAVRDQFRRAFHKRKPFYARKVFERLESLFRLVDTEIVGFQISGAVPRDGESLREYQQNVAAIIATCEAVCEAIRERLEALR